MSEGGVVDSWLLDHLVCPRDHGPLRDVGHALTCTTGHTYPVVAGVPVMLLDDDLPAFEQAAASWSRAASGRGDERAPDLYLESVGISDTEKRGVIELAARPAAVDPVAAFLVAATNGLMYRHLIGALRDYPIPDPGLPPAAGDTLLDVGCSWGRWTVAAARRGYTAVGIDPSLGAVMAARRVARQLGLPPRYVVGDARHLPFATHQFDRVFSYSVIQHLSRGDADRAIAEMGRTLRPGGEARVQMPNRLGVRCLYHQARRRFRDGAGFEVRYWSRQELRRCFTRRIGPTRLDVDCYFGIGLQPADAHLMTPPMRLVLGMSELLKRVGRRLPALARVADSVFVVATKS